MNEKFLISATYANSKYAIVVSAGDAATAAWLVRRHLQRGAKTVAVRLLGNAEWAGTVVYIGMDWAREDDEWTAVDANTAFRWKQHLCDIGLHQKYFDEFGEIEKLSEFHQAKAAKHAERKKQTKRELP